MILLHRTLLVAALTLITWLALSSNPPLGAPVFSFDKINHIAAFLVLAYLVDYSFPAARHIKWGWAGLLGYGFTLELLQYQTGYRYFEWLDVLADGVGIAVYALSRPLAHQAHSWISDQIGQ